MKNSLTAMLTLAGSLMIGASTAHAQVLLGIVYNGNSQVPAVYTDFAAAGVVLPAGTFNVDAFNIGNQFTYGGTPIVAPDGLGIVYDGTTFSFGGQNSTGNPVYQQALLGHGITISGLSALLNPNTTYTLDVLANSVTFGAGVNSNTSFTYGSQTASDNGVATVHGAVIPFSFTTGSSVLDTLTLSTGASASGSADYPGLSGFAIISSSSPAVPEPATYPLLGLGLLALLTLRRFRFMY